MRVEGKLRIRKELFVLHHAATLAPARLDAHLHASEPLIGGKRRQRHAQVDIRSVFRS